MKWLKYAISIIFINLCPASYAQVDMGIESLIRSFPQAVYLKATGGYSASLWEKRDKSPVLYGFVRPMASVRTSGIINAFDGRLEIYPISFFGIVGGRETVLRQAKSLDTFDCASIDCQGRVYKDYFGGRMALKFKSTFLMADMRTMALSFNHSNRRFSEELSTLEAGPSKDRLVNFIGIVGQEINDQYAAALLHMENSMQNTSQKSSMTFLLMQKKLQSQTFLTGPGLFKTRTDSQIFSLLFLWNWKPEKGLVLF
ncbi:MAG: hypothetical protein HYV97_17585 [Bdellovibrio sp.]|nr:hypothetical protein [Bdellovibrio sp.]